MEILINQAPGGIPDIYECPYCSKSYVAVETDTNGDLKLEFEERGGEKVLKRTMEPPATCRRCGSPMDVTKAQAFQDKMAVDASGPVAARERPTVKV